MEEVATPLAGAAHHGGPRTVANGNAPFDAVPAPQHAPLIAVIAALAFGARSWA
jgi:hypothetical protein